LQLLAAEKALTRHGDKLAQMHQQPPWVRVDEGPLRTPSKTPAGF
jgi:predicted dithiol-disulfide oxidoreductase (DUF899 family)